MRSKKIQVEAWTSIYEGKKQNNLSQLVELFGTPEVNDPVESDEPELLFPDPSIKEEKKKEKPKPLAPDHIIILDDVGDELRDQAVTQLLKTNCHCKCQVIISSQHCYDLMPAARKQIDVWLLFAKLAEDTLKVVFKDADFPVSWSEFLNMYKLATREKYSFLYAWSNGDFRIKFSQKLITDE